MSQVHTRPVTESLYVTDSEIIDIDGFGVYWRRP